LKFSAEAALIKPTTGIAPCCAYDGNGNVPIAEPATILMNSRRLNIASEL
jgi:hypothetical protein